MTSQKFVFAALLIGLLTVVTVTQKITAHNGKKCTSGKCGK